MAATPLLPSTVAVMTVLPGETALTTPFAPTLATLGRLELHATDRPERTPPRASSGSAASCAVSPTVRSRLDGETRTATTGTGTTWTCATAAFPSIVAAMGTDPTYRPVTMPLGETVAKLESAVVQNTLRPMSGLPSTSSAEAVSV